ncbi:MAG TPA: hypothetical protein VG222_06655 [Vicinamibacterales bacterium]|nr:hypothetical protein [Vicinamibacterales bacterium]
MLGLIPRIGDDNGDGLAGVVNLVVLQRQVRLAVRVELAPRFWRRIHARHVPVRESGNHAGGSFGGSRIERCKATVRDDGMDD